MIFPLRCKIIIKNFPHALAENDICRFRDFLKSEEKEPATIEKYVKEIKSFCEWLCGRPVTKEAVIEWKERLQKQEYVPVTVNGKLSALNGFFFFYGMDGNSGKISPYPAPDVQGTVKGAAKGRV